MVGTRRTVSHSEAVERDPQMTPGSVDFRRRKQEHFALSVVIPISSQRWLKAQKTEVR